MRRGLFDSAHRFRRAAFDSLDIMERVMRHFYLRALIEERMGNRTDWKQVDGLMMLLQATTQSPAATLP